MAFFEKFPLIFYDLTGNKPTQLKVTTDILSRVKMLNSIKNESYVYYTYDVQDGDTPETIASKYYNDSNKHWIILLANDIVDPTYDWPLSSRDFEAYIIDKYGSYSNAATQIHHYEKVITKTDSVTQTITVNRYEIDLTTYNSMSASETDTYNLVDGNTVKVVTTKLIVYAYDYENELNESKRKIRIIDNRYVSQIENELTNLLNNNGR